MSPAKPLFQPATARREISLDEVSNGAVTFVGAPVDAAPGRRNGVALGPNALRLAFDDVFGVFLNSPGGAIGSGDNGAAPRLIPEAPICDIGDLASPVGADAVKPVCRLIASPGAILVVLGGSRNLASCCLEAATEIDPGIACVHLSPKILPGDRIAGANTCFVGTNGLISQHLWNDAMTGDATVIRASQVYEEGVESAAHSLGAFLRRQQSVFWHIDAAVIDSGHAAGAPDLNIGGLSPEQLLGILDAVATETRVAGCVVTNVAPDFDKRGLSEFVAAEALLRVLSPRLMSLVA